MTVNRWSPADLNQQVRVVRAIAERAELDRRRLIAARRSFGARVRGVLTSPAVLAGAFAVGFLVLRPAPRRKGATVVRRVGSRMRQVGASIVWLTQIYRQFSSGLAVGAALAARTRNTPTHAVPDQEIS